MKLDRIGASIFFVIGAILLREGLQMTYMGTNASPGPGFFPVWIGIILMSLSAVLFLTTKSKDKPFIESKEGFLKATMVALSFVVYIFALPLLGILLGLFFFLAFLVGWVEKKPLKNWVLVSVLGSGACFVLFKVWLNVPLPRGVLGI